MRPIALLSACLSMALGVGFGCSSSPTTSDGGTDASNDVASDTAAGSDAAGDAAPDAPTGDGGSGFSLIINDYLSWCAVTVNGGTPSTMDPQVFTFAPNTVVNLQGDKANATFVWGYWVGTDNAPDGGDTQMTTTVTMTSNKFVQACCPLASSPNTPCP